MSQCGGVSDLTGGGGSDDDEAVFDPLAWPEGADETSQKLAGMLHNQTLVRHAVTWRRGGVRIFLNAWGELQTLTIPFEKPA